MSKLKKKKTQKKQANNIFKSILYILGIFVSILLIVSSTWAVNYFGNVNFNEIFFHLLVPMEGTNEDVIIKYIYDCIPITLISTLIIFSFIYLYTKNKLVFNFKLLKHKFKFTLTSIKRKEIILFIFFIFSIIYSLIMIDFTEFIKYQFTNSDFFKNNYVDPKNVELIFPEEKQNLIYIYLESMEYTYEDMNLIPELTKLRTNNVSFNSSHGAYSIGNTTWTVAGIVAETGGIPLNTSLHGNSIGLYKNFLPGLYNIGDILKDNGYDNYFTIGSDSSFAARDKYFTQHGDYNIWDTNSAILEGKITTSDLIWWGIVDSDLFEYAKEQLTNLDKSKPFNFTLLTTDTHHPDGYISKDCPNNYDLQYKNAISCSDTKIYEFIKWIQKQPWYENTTIVLAGDHPSMNVSLFENLPTNYDRTVYTTIINPVISYNQGNREYTTLDLFPTTLASLGVNIEGNRLGLGTNLFSDEKTLIEIYGKDYVNDEIKKNSNYYNQKFRIK